MPIQKLKEMPAFQADAPQHIRLAIGLLCVVWLVECFMFAKFVDIAMGVPLTPKTHDGFFLLVFLLAFWLVLNACLIVGLCQRQRLARWLELLLTVVTTIFCLSVSPPLRLSLYETAFLANAAATVLLFLGPCTHWFRRVPT
ncbi:hypothetical protein LMG24238_00092 [Paraburkholderia sediminicola]|uniref:Uncharacterized protein n=1 Tax=Paraburkholderia sediminicola TaxID=458836 RepID=A0A6J4ZRI9_9BURK|nr:hypothetical protein LMG24238_00092 [Paraburkholderia sediminicola]